MLGTETVGVERKTLFCATGEESPVLKNVPLMRNTWAKTSECSWNSSAYGKLKCCFWPTWNVKRHADPSKQIKVFRREIKRVASLGAKMHCIWRNLTHRQTLTLPSHLVLGFSLFFSTYLSRSMLSTLERLISSSFIALWGPRLLIDYHVV